MLLHRAGLTASAGLSSCLHTYYTFLSTLNDKFLISYLQLWRSYAILSAITQCTWYAQNVRNAPKHVRSDICISRW